MKTTYRDFEIEYDTLVGQFVYLHKDSDEFGRWAGMCNTEQGCKEEIDRWCFYNVPVVYRDFEIKGHSFFGGDHVQYVHKDYDGPGDSRIGDARDVIQAKRMIDEWYVANTSYKVEYSMVRPAKEFDSYSEAESFCKYWNLSLDSISILLLGDVFEFDAP